jgi:hypothetical protein
VTIRELVFGCALAWAIPSCASVIVQLKVLEGEGTVYRTGSRATRGLSVLVTDETGKPVANAAVSFQLPGEGATGTFFGLSHGGTASSSTALSNTGILIGNPSIYVGHP